ncbi:MAG: DUF3300 domain-containing protein, partial [Acetobacteraceae bacterium]|nr:DUF3300 domain-containing protein [Acetobacteraceae bacterium]
MPVWLVRGRLAISLLAGCAVLLPALPAPGPAWAQSGTGTQAAAPAPADDLLSQAQLEQLLAPIALYPDELLMQMLMASTYPLEVVQAKRWLGQGQNGALRGEALATALQAQPWDPSVKSLVPFPDVLGMMNDQLDWTQRLGDALLAQQEDVLNTIQVLRNRAQAAGTLQSGPQQTVTVSQTVTVAPPVAGAPVAVVPPPPQVIAIAPAQPQQVFVPVYDPSVMFGPWPHPAYPPVFFPPPPAWGLGNAILTGMAFAGGVAIVNSLWGWARPGWGRGSVNIDVNRVNAINVNRTQVTNNVWRHDVTHRHGVAYRDPAVRDRFRPPAGGGAAVADRDQRRDELRGRLQPGGGGLGDGRPGAGDRPGLG